MIRGCVDISPLSPFTIMRELVGAMKRGCGWWSRREARVVTLNVEFLNQGFDWNLVRIKY